VNPTFLNATRPEHHLTDPDHPGHEPSGSPLETIVSTPTDSLVRVEKGHAAPEELAALTALLLARAAASGSAGSEASGPVRSTAKWRRLERTPGFRAPHSWQG
jgi:hypothetical protein